MRYLEQHSWPGNVGELDGYISALLTEYPKEVIDESQFDSRFQLSGPSIQEQSFAQLEMRQDREKRQFIQQAVQNSKSILRAAQRLGMKPSSLNTLITRFGMRNELRGEKR